MMSKSELIGRMAQSAGITREQAKLALEALTDHIGQTLNEGRDVRIVGFGSFSLAERAAGKARNPRTGETVERPASRTARFRVGEGLKSLLNG
ncbi:MULTISPECIES: HU family DNA-binding protein [unclassified Brevundimonas]|uniref:HU family DNA-binding protein n=1 Tax=unclassified Brevundimonas TaxID=2622653 RepID=UPI0025C51B42|nr:MULTISPECIES: HU family DNA-binding protein [unclassified Brevundimonas]